MNSRILKLLVLVCPFVSALFVASCSGVKIETLEQLWELIEQNSGLSERSRRYRAELGIYRMDLRGLDISEIDSLVFTQMADANMIVNQLILEDNSLEVLPITVKHVPGLREIIIRGNPLTDRNWSGIRGEIEAAEIAVLLA